MAQLFLDALWIIFLVVATSAGYSMRIENSERFVWFPADLAVLFLLYWRHEEFLHLMKENAIFVFWALLACVSALWSLAPGISLYHGTQLFFTVMVGFMLLMRADLERILQYIFVALFICAAGSIAYTVIWPEWAFFRGGAWVGLYPHKNVLGAIMTLLIMTSICLLLHGWRPLLSSLGFVSGVSLLLLSRSGTAIVACTLTLAVVPLALSFRKGPLTFTVCVGLMIVALAGGLLMFEVMDDNVVTTVLASLGKDETLTGRTAIWDMGIEAYETRPWLGHGYKGYWEGVGTTASQLRFLMQVTIGMFHNNFVEVAVAFGFMGPVVLVLGLLIGLVRGVRAFVLDPEPLRLWPIMVVVLTFILCFAENPLFANHGMYQLLLVVAVGSAGFARRTETD